MITWYKEPMVAEVGGITLFTKKKSASSGLRLILFLGLQVVDFEDSVIRDPCTHCRTWWGSRTVQLWDLREPGTSFCPDRQSWVNIQVSYSVCFLEYLVSFNISRSPLGSLSCWQVAWQQENTGCFHYFRVAHYHAIAIHITQGIWMIALLRQKTWSYSMTKYIFVAKKLRCWVYTWPLETSQRWQEPCPGISSWSSPPRLSSSQTGAPPCTKTQKSAIASWKSLQNTEALAA